MPVDSTNLFDRPWLRRLCVYSLVGLMSDVVRNQYAGWKVRTKPPVTFVNLFVSYIEIWFVSFIYRGFRTSAFGKVCS